MGVGTGRVERCSRPAVNGIAVRCGHGTTLCGARMQCCESRWPNGVPQTDFA